MRFLTTRPMVLIGLWSYSWYLWHWPLLAISRANALQNPNLPRDLGIGVVSLVAAAVTYYRIENPIRYKRPGPFSKPVSTLWMGAAISVLIAASAAMLALSARHVGREPRYAAAERPDTTHHLFVVLATRTIRSGASQIALDASWAIPRR